MPARTRSPSQFKDVSVILDAAIEAGGGTYRLPTPAKATKWRARAYSLRALLLRLDEERKAQLVGVAPSTVYDGVILRIYPEDPCAVHIEMSAPEGILTRLDGTPLGYGMPSEQDELEEAAADLLKELGL